MKIHIIFFSCLCTSLAITVHYETTGSSNKNKEYKTTLKDIRLVPINQSNAIQKPVTVRNEETTEIKSPQKPGDSRAILQNSQKFRGNKKNVSISRIGNSQNDPNHQNYMLKMANQLYMAQKHASVLSDYQKFILNQDPKVKNFVLAQSTQERNPKPTSRQRPTGRSLPTIPKFKYLAPEPVAAPEFKKIVVVTPKVPTAVQKIPQSQNDHSIQATHIKYVTLAPQPLSPFVESHGHSPKVTLVPFHSSQPYTYYDSVVTHKPQIETVHIPTVASAGLSSYESSPVYKNEDEPEGNLHHDNAKYEFMYKVKDQEKHNHFGHMESRTDKATYGYYFVHLPDGRLETVKYWADKTGYHAKVDYQGEAKHPPHTESKLHSSNLVHH